MPRKRWSRAEIRTLKRHRDAGKSASEILASGVLPGRSKGSIEAVLRRKGWVD